MGNRAVIAIQQDETETDNFVLLYGHYSGGDNLNAVLNTLRRTDRIGDPAYLTAQIFYEFARMGDYNGELGFGIYQGTRGAIDETDNPAVFVNPYNGVITYQGETLTKNHNAAGQLTA
jgi:hypothetical protein